MLALTMVGFVVASHHAYAFGEVCVVLDDSAKIQRRIELKHSILPGRVRDVAVSPDGKQLALTSWSEAAKNFLLFVWDLDTGVIRPMGEAHGFHAAPSFTNDQQWLYFVHHPTLGGPVGMHEARAYAQLGRQRLEAGAPVEMLTSSDGCHMESAPREGRVYFAHSSCSGGRRIEVFENGKETALTAFDSQLGEPSVSFDGKWLVASRVVGDRVEIVELQIAKPKALNVVWSGMRGPERFHPVYIDSRRSLVFQNGAMLHKLDRSKKTASLELIGGIQ